MKKFLKRALYFILIIAELFLDWLFMGGLWNSTLYIPLVISVVAVTGLLIWQLVRFAKVTDLTIKKKILRNIALILLMPIAIFFVVYIVVAISMIIAFA